jgi:ribosomal protein S21
MSNIEVKRKPNEKIESLILRFTRKVMKSGLLKEYRNRQRFKTNAEKKRIKKENRNNV